MPALWKALHTVPPRGITRCGKIIIIKDQFMAIISTPQYEVAIHIRGAHPLGEQRTKDIFHAVEATTKLPCNKLTTTC